MAEDQPEWLKLFCAAAPAEDVAKAWKEGLTEEGRKEAEADPPTARARLRRLIVDSEAPEVRRDADNGWKYTGAILRAADAVLGIPPPKPRGYAFGKGPAASGSGAPAVSRRVAEGDGRPGSLGLFWSDYGGAINIEQLKALGVTRRLNVAAEAVGKLTIDESIPITDVPMEDIFDEEKAINAIGTWKRQLSEILSILRTWREEGQIVNVNCQMGKNRSGTTCLIWLCAECGWEVNAAVDHLRKITALALGNPHLVRAAVDFLKVEAEVPLNPAGDGGGWVCISPPGSPRAGGTAEFEATAAQALNQLRSGGGGDAAAELAAKLQAHQDTIKEEPEEEEEDADVAPILGELSDVD
mmetsp:Transcript_7400/g.16724  ORF Transcript_7400/g.16724 Transcript_7400/m.16724 type:complete len:355 (+) Transcript_7400:209-1273(+)|eukprot:CAMPEP_0206487924 /NCGR_PEP_ID=MMETSP0324_2-20121206/42013_1 /ASSEMBLY_ACC=CAM_ASM_000836 /TAXON_ID=2866 /ORGANISM="Crypthecodinium cohnii, Strain Seligo" /LENGTH=354 /DNA_ID=CAMNT_0053966663 /DNA_START=131 /DNA_END=1195 /DNA_ORIENTATION=+